MKETVSRGQMVDEEVIDQGLMPMATTPERVDALIVAGIQPAHIAMATKSSVSTVRNWRVGATEPRADRSTTIDDLRYAMGQLVNGGVSAPRAAMFLKSRADTPPFERPIEIIGRQPLKVFAMTERLLGQPFRQL